jgi:luciferase family oxidoreductase group 1
MAKLSILDLSPICQGGSARDALLGSLALAQHAERLGFHRFWLAEHHNFPGVASAATAVVLAHLAAGTRTLRLGAGGIMLPNHAPLLVAEQFGTLEALHPGRIDLGLGRAPGSDLLTQRALRRGHGAAEAFAEDVQELLAWFEPAQPGQAVQAIPGAGLRVPVYILGSSLYGAQLAAKLGLPYAFAAHFAPQQLDDAIAIYRRRFVPSKHLSAPYVIVGANVVAAETEGEARRLFSSVQQAFVLLRRGTPSQLPPPDAHFGSGLSADDRSLLDHALRFAVVGTQAAVADGLARLIQCTGADELILTSQIYDARARFASFEIVASLMPALQGGGASAGPADATPALSPYA